MKLQIKKQLWAWPDGLVWKATARITENSRRRRYELFLKLIAPTPNTTILDAGAGGDGRRARNFLEVFYPYPDKITALGNDPKELDQMKKTFPKIKVVKGDVRKLPFEDKSFDVVFSNAVLEHVGGREHQRRFTEECFRVGKKVFIATPAREFPVDPHTLIPLAHWLPLRIRNLIYRGCGREFWASEERLHLLNARALRRLLYGLKGARLITKRLGGIPATHIVFK